MTHADQARLLLRKASQDQDILERLIGDPSIEDESLGFHAQQAAEKLLKALLVIHGLDYPRTHDLDLLLGLLERGGVVIPDPLQRVVELSPMATVYRYEDLPLDLNLPRGQWPHWIAGLRAMVEAKLGSA